MDNIKIKAPAKINLSLDILGTRNDGYHFVDMIMHSVSMYDYITLSKRNDKKIVIKSSDKSMPTDKRNIAYKSAQIFFEHTKIVNGGVNIFIDKQIPVCAGLAGGSADSAAVFYGLNKLYNTGLSQKQLCEISEQAGADVAFCITGGAARVSGVGEKIQSIPAYEGLYAVVVKPLAGASTKKVYSLYDKSPSDIRIDNEKIIKAIQEKNVKMLCENMGNVLQSVTCSFVSGINDIIYKLDKNGAKKAMMSGSGSATYGLFEDYESAINACDYLKRSYKQVFLCKLISHGAIECE